MTNRAGTLRMCGVAAAAIGAAGLCGAESAGQDWTGTKAIEGPAATFSGYQRAAYYAPVRDGTRLALTVYRPTGGVSSTGRFSTILWYVPGHRESIDLATGKITSAMAADDLAFFTSHGYAVAIAEMRGSGASFGTRVLDRGPQIGLDGKDLVDWIAAQPWSDGRLGMVGASYQGFSQYATAAQRPKALKAIFPEIAGFDDYSSMFYPGGIMNVALSDFASASIVRDDLNYFTPQEARPRRPSVPVVDEDGDGELIDEVPVDRDGDGDFLDDGPPTYRDGAKRQDVYLQATRQHVGNANLTVAKLAAAPHRDSRVGGTPYTFVDIDPGAKPASIAASGIAVYNRGGWFDYHARDTALWFATLRGRTPTNMMMAPTGHGGLPAEGAEAIYRAGPYFALFGDTRSTNTMMNREKLAFFDRYVRGLANGFDRRPPVLLYVMGRGWRYEAAWPLARQRLTRFALSANGTLTEDAQPAGEDRYTVDFGVSSLSSKANRWNYGVSTTRTPLTLDADAARRLSYVTAPLAMDTEVTGHPIVDLVFSSTAAESDVFVYLEDVAADGTSLLVSEGELRANYHRLKPIDTAVARSAPIAVQPKLPWQGFARADYRAAPLARGKPLTLRLDLMPTSWVFRRGHRIRVSFAGADFPSFALHPRLSPANNPGDPRNIVPVWTVRRGPGLSGITLPIIPGA